MSADPVVYARVFGRKIIRKQQWVFPVFSKHLIMRRNYQAGSKSPCHIRRLLKRHVTDDVFPVSPSVTPINRKEHHIKFSEFPKLSVHSFINTGVAGMIQGASAPLQNTAHIGVGTCLWVLVKEFMGRSDSCYADIIQKLQGDPIVKAYEPVQVYM